MIFFDIIFTESIKPIFGEIVLLMDYWVLIFLKESGFVVESGYKQCDASAWQLQFIDASSLQGMVSSYVYIERKEHEE